MALSEEQKKEIKGVATGVEDWLMRRAYFIKDNFLEVTFWLLISNLFTYTYVRVVLC